MEKSWHMKNWQKVMAFCDQSWNFASKFYQIRASFADIKKSSISLESLYLPNLFRKMLQMQNLSREMVMEN